MLSSIASSYEDEHLDDDVVLYDYAPPSFEWANEGLKHVASLGRPVILLKQVKPKPNPEYMVLAPVTLLAFDDGARKMRLSLTSTASDAAGVPPPQPTVFAKAYAETVVKARLHQAHFRKATLAAYSDRCCICELAERPLLDAAHIVPDRLPEGMATVRNGLAMCPTHHRAFDQDLLVVTAELRVDVRHERLAHAGTGPTRAALTDFHGKALVLPKHQALWPDLDLIRARLKLVA
jgi:putative restriction endonuclease